MNTFNLKVDYLKKYYSYETIDQLKLVSKLHRSVMSLDSNISFMGIKNFVSLANYNLLFRSLIVLDRSKLVDSDRLSHNQTSIYYRLDNDEEISLLDFNVTRNFQNNLVLLHGRPVSSSIIKDEISSLEERRNKIYFNEAINYALGDIDYSDTKMKQYATLRSRVGQLKKDLSYYDCKSEEEEYITRISSDLLLGDWGIKLKHSDKNNQYENNLNWTKIIRK